MTEPRPVEEIARGVVWESRHATAFWTDARRWEFFSFPDVQGRVQATAAALTIERERAEVAERERDEAYEYLRLAGNVQHEQRERIAALEAGLRRLRHERHYHGGIERGEPCPLCSKTDRLLTPPATTEEPR